MDTPGLSTNQAPSRTELRQGADATAPMRGEQVQTPETSRAPSAVTESAAAKAVAKQTRGQDETDNEKSALPKTSPESPSAAIEKFPADLSPADLSAAYAQVFGPNSDADNELASQLFLEVRNLFDDEA